MKSQDPLFLEETLSRVLSILQARETHAWKRAYDQNLPTQIAGGQNSTAHDARKALALLCCDTGRAYRVNKEEEVPFCLPERGATATELHCELEELGLNIELQEIHTLLDILATDRKVRIDLRFSRKFKDTVWRIAQPGEQVVTKLKNGGFIANQLIPQEPKPMTPGEREVWEVLEERSLTAAQIVQQLYARGICSSSAMVRQHIFGISKKGFIIITERRSGYWRPDAPPPE